MSGLSRNWPMPPVKPTRPWNRDWPGSAKNSKNNYYRICAMNTNRDFEKDDPLLNAVLGDETWQTANAAGKAAALGTFRSRQRTRRVMRWTGYAVALAAVITCGAYWLGRSVTPALQIVQNPTAAPKDALPRRSLTDAEMIGSFPEGSCFLAEIDGKKQLV